MRWPIFDGVPEDDVQQVLSIARRRTFARGEVVFHADDPADTVHLIVSGRFAARVQTPLGDSAILTVLGPGAIFGELALLGADQRRTATIEALERAETRSIFRDDFQALRTRHPGVNEVLIAVLRDEVTRLSRHLMEALYTPAEKRIRRRLIEVADAYTGADADGTSGPVTVPLRQEDLAGLAGTSRATVNRVLREEEKRGTLTLGRGRVEITDPAAIKRRGR